MARSKPITEPDAPPAPRGRPRDPLLEKRLQEAALATLAERGFAGLTVDAICTRAGLPRSSFYRRWDSAASALLDGFNAAARLERLPDTGDLLQDLVNFGLQITELFSDPVMNACIAFLSAEARLRPDLHERLILDLQARRAFNRGIVERAVARGETVSIDADLLLDVLNGLALTASGRLKRWSREDFEELVLRLLGRSAPA